jgi:hypothetical protein
MPALVRADDAGTLLAKHRAFVGWQLGDGTMRALRLERRLQSASGSIAEDAVELHAGMLYRRDYVFTNQPQMPTSSGFTGNLFWSVSNHGVLAPVSGTQAQTLLAIDTLFSEGVAELPASVVGSAVIDGGSAAILNVTMRGAAPLQVYEDPTTGAFLRVVINPGQTGKLTYVIHSYLTIAPNKRIIGTWSVSDTDGTYSYVRMRQADVQAQDLRPPGAATWTFASNVPFPIHVTQQRIYVDAAVNGVTGRFILDTGSQGIVVTDAFAERAGLPVIAHGSANGMSGEERTLVRRVDTIEVGGNTLSNLIVSSLPALPRSDERRTPATDGFLGFDLFEGAIVVVNTAAQEMQLLDPEIGAPAATGIVLEPDFSDLTPVVRLRINDAIDVDARLDSGDSSLTLFSSAANTAMLPTSLYDISGIGYEETVACGTLASMRVGAMTFHNTGACRTPSLSEDRAIVGFDFMRHFDYIFDYPHGKITLIPHPGEII